MVDEKVIPSMWPGSLQALVHTDRRHHNLNTQGPEMDGQLLQKENTFADSAHFEELLHSSQSGVTYQASLAKLWEDRQANAVSLLRKQLDTLNQQRLEAEQRQRQILEEHIPYSVFPPDVDDDNAPRSIEGFFCEERSSSWSSVLGSVSSMSEIEGDYPAEYWREKARMLEKLLSESMLREEALDKKLQETSETLPEQQYLEDLRKQVARLDNFLRFSLRKSPVIVAHQDKDLRYRFIYNAFPTLREEEVIGKTDIEIYQGMGVPELMEFKRSVLRTGWPEKREIHFETNLFGVKTFLIAVEPVFSTSGATIGLNYVATDVTEQVDKREKLARLREDVAVQKAMESELHKTIHITEETMRAKQILATMSHEIRSPLSGVVSMAEVLATTPLDPEQRQVVEVMVSSGDLVLQLINDILDLSKVESGAMKLEAKKFRPREVVKHVLQMALASVQDKHLILEGVITDDVPLEVIGDILRIRQVFHQSSQVLPCNALKFTHEGGVGIILRVESSPNLTTEGTGVEQTHSSQEEWAAASQSSRHPLSADLEAQDSSLSRSSTPPSLSGQRQLGNDQLEDLGMGAVPSAPPFPFPSRLHLPQVRVVQPATVLRLVDGGPDVSETAESCQSCQFSPTKGEEFARYMNQRTSSQGLMSEGSDGDSLSSHDEEAETIWLHCDICDTGIGIPEAALPSLFEKYTQVSTTHARQYGGTGLGLAICKQLVELMGGTLTVASKENVGSTFTFKLPLQVVKDKASTGPQSDEVYRMLSDEQEVTMDKGHEHLAYKKFDYFHFTSTVTGSSSSSNTSTVQPLFNPNFKGNSSAVATLTGSAMPKSRSPLAHGIGVNLSDIDQSILSTNMSTSPFSSVSRDHGLTSLRYGTKDYAVAAPTKSRAVSLKTQDSYRLRNSAASGGSQADSTHTKGGYLPGLSLSQCQSPGPLVNRSVMQPGFVSQSWQAQAHSLPGPGPSKKGGKMHFVGRPPAPVASPQRSRQQRPSRILLAEDNKVNVMVAQSMLKRLGHTLEVVSNGAEAVQALQRSTYDLILMDVCMPVMDGLEATRRIRKFEETGLWADTNEADTKTMDNCSFSEFPPAVRLPDTSSSRASLKRRTPIIAMTANALADNMVECYTHGMDSFIAKPVTFQKLEQVLKQFIPCLPLHERQV